MIFLLSQMAISLVLAALVGACIGWLLHRSRYSGQVDQYRQLALRQQKQVKQAQSDVAMLTDDYDELKRHSQSEIDSLKQETKQLPALNQNLEKSQLLVRQLMQKHEAQLRELTAENDSLKGKLKNIGHREQALNQLQAGLEKTRRRAQQMSAASVDDDDTDLTKPLAAASTVALADLEEEAGDQTSLDLDGEHESTLVNDDDPNDDLQVTAEDSEAFESDLEDDPDSEDEDDELDEDVADDADALDDDEYEYVYEDEDEDDADSEYDEEAEYDDDEGDFEDDEYDAEAEYEGDEDDFEDEDAEYEDGAESVDEDEVEYLDDASDRMLQTKKPSGRKQTSSKKKTAATKKKTAAKKSPAKPKRSQKNSRGKAGTEAAVAKRSNLVDPEPLEQLFDSVDQHDDLQQIFGIGPVTEKALNKLGITSYSQLADLKRHDIEKIADALQIFPGRIERDNWVGSATRQLEEVLEEL
ncbi:MAG: hypothetical protein KTR35_10445 [Gammaproteobacteria bacterium]|nr:hypothetical protein [Gammaproteobacteria bacterium]